MEFSYKTKGVCARSILIDVEDDTVKGVRFEGGCSGNTQGISRLVEGLSAEEVLQRLSGIRCGLKSTSCPDQLATALEQALQQG